MRELSKCLLACYRTQLVSIGGSCWGHKVVEAHSGSFARWENQRRWKWSSPGGRSTLTKRRETVSSRMPPLYCIESSSRPLHLLRVIYLTPKMWFFQLGILDSRNIIGRFPFCPACYDKYERNLTCVWFIFGHNICSKSIAISVYHFSSSITSRSRLAPNKRPWQLCLKIWKK